MPKFLISMLALNRLAATKACVAAVLANSEDYVLLIHDNGSIDGTAEYLRDLRLEHPEINVTSSEENQGFIVPNCRGFEIARELGIPYFVALNNDTVPPPGWLNWLALPLDLDENAALSGPGGGCHKLMDNFDGTGGGAWEYVEGACLCAKVAIVQQYGRLFSDYLDFIYGDDSDLSLRMRERGYTIHEANFTMPHARGETVQTQPEVKARCNAAQQHNHRVLMKRWGHYLKVRRFDYPIVLKRTFAIGDILLMTPIIRAIRESNPLSPIFVHSGVPEIFDRNPNVDVVVRGLQSDPPDALVVNLDMAYENRPMMHIVQAYEQVTREVVRGLGPVELRTELYSGEEAMDWAGKTRNQFAGHKDRVCVLHAENTTWAGKNWPVERFALLAEWLTKNGWRVVVVGNSKPPQLRNVVDLTGQTDIAKLAAILRLSQLFVGNDSFPMHAALSTGCPTIGLFGVSSSRFIMTNGSAHIGLDADPAVPCAGERHRATGTTMLDCSPDCINSITLERVQMAVEALLK